MENEAIEGRNEKQKMTNNKKLLYISISLISLLLLFIPLIFPIQLRQFTSLGLIGIFIINLIGSATMFVPSVSFISIGIGGHLYNPLLVALIGAIGSSLGELVGYLFGFSSKKVINFDQKHKLLNGFMEFLFEKYGSMVIFIFSFIPNPIFDGIGIFAGLSGYPPRKFFILVFLGRVLRYVGIAYIGKLF